MYERNEDVDDECEADYELPSIAKSEVHEVKAAPAAASSPASKASSSPSSSTGTTPIGAHEDSASKIPAGDGVKSKKGCASWWAEAVGASWAYDWYVVLRHIVPLTSDWREDTLC